MTTGSRQPSNHSRRIILPLQQQFVGMKYTLSTQNLKNCSSVTGLLRHLKFPVSILLNRIVSLIGLTD